MADKPHFGAMLAGGRSERFGSPKAFAQIAGSTMLERILAQFRRAGLHPIIVANDLKGFRTSGVPVVSDVIPGAGPLGGMHAALIAAREADASGVCFTPCDAPLVDGGLFRGLLDSSVGYEAVLPIDDSSGRIQPLFGWYSSRIAPLIETRIATGDCSVSRFVDRLAMIRFIHSDDLVMSTPAKLVFFNVNTPADMKVARDAVGDVPRI